MNLVTMAIYFAGALLGLVAIANFFAPGMLHYRENVARLDKLVGQVFIVHCFYTVLTVTGMAVACFCFADELASGQGWLFCLFMAVFWGSRVFLQLFYYDQKVKRERPVFNVMFLAAFVWVAGVFGFLTIK